MDTLYTKFNTKLKSKNKGLEILKEYIIKKNNDKINFNSITEPKKYLIPSKGESNDKLVQIFEEHLIYNGMKYNLTTWMRDLRYKKRISKKKFKVYSCQ